MSGAALLKLAEAWATVAHEGQSRKGDLGEDYIEHPARMAANARGWYRKVLCWMHDVIEDADDPEAMYYAVKTVFGDDIARDLLWLTRVEKHTWFVKARIMAGLPHLTSVKRGQKQVYQEWIRDLAQFGNENVIAVKLLDLEDNLADRDNSRYLRAKATLLEARS